MKNKYLKLYSYLAITLVFVFLTGCKDNKNIESDYAKAGIELCEKFVQIYQTINEQSYIDKYQREMISILSNAKPEEMQMPNSEFKAFSPDFEQKIECFNLLRRVYQAYNLISDTKFSNNNTRAVEAIDAVCDAIKTLQVSAALKESITNDADQIKVLAHDSKFEKFEVLFRLNELVYKVFESDTKKWKGLFNDMYNSFDEGLKNVPAKVFDLDKISRLVNEPYSDKGVLVNLYKIKLREKVFSEKNKIETHLDKLISALQTYILASSELAKKRPVEQDVILAVDKVKDLLKK